MDDTLFIYTASGTFFKIVIGKLITCLFKVGFLDGGFSQCFGSKQTSDSPPDKSQWKDYVWLNKRNINREKHKFVEHFAASKFLLMVVRLKRNNSTYFFFFLSKKKYSQ